MSQITDDNGNIITYQGDTFKIMLSGIDTSHSYTAYCQIRNNAGKAVGTQQSISTNNLPDIEFKIPHTVSDLMTVPSGQDTETYYYGVKLVYDGDEDTVFIGENANFETENTITVYRKKVDGE